MKLEAANGRLPDTLMAESPSGSQHRYSKHPGGGIQIKNSASEIAPGVDVLGDGGMVIAPPSIRKDGVYRWLHDLPIADAPDWLIELVRRKPRPVGSNGSQPPEIDIGLLAAAMAVIPKDPQVDEPEWNRIGMALFRGAGGNDTGRDLFDAWSQQSPKYDAPYTAKQWDKYERSPPSEIGGANHPLHSRKSRTGLASRV